MFLKRRKGGRHELSPHPPLRLASWHPLPKGERGEASAMAHLPIPSPLSPFGTGQVPQRFGGPGEATTFMINKTTATNYGDQKNMARELRRNETEAEKKLWTRLRNRHLGGFKFRRQFPIGPFFADFCCVSQRLIVELDGSQHSDEKDRDANQTAWLIKQGFRVIRFWNDDVLKKTDAVCIQILDELLNPYPVAEHRATCLSLKGRGDGYDVKTCAAPLSP